MTYQFCTYFDANYLPQALALYESLVRHCSPFHLWMLCMDDESHAVLSRMSLPHVRLIALKEFECGDAALLEAKSNRSRLEYYFTCTPSLPLYVFDQGPDIQLLTYLDADLFFFGDPAPIFEEMGDRSILVIEHRFAPPWKWMEEGVGKFNVGLLSFRRDEQGMACLKWWRERCLERCFYRHGQDCTGDQKYLDEWPRLFSPMAVLQHKGAGLGPCNIANYEITSDGDTVKVSGDLLIVYHFSGLRKIGWWMYDAGLKSWGCRLAGAIRACIYRPYLQAVLRASHLVQQHASVSPSEFASLKLRPRPRSAWRRLCFYAGLVYQFPKKAVDRLTCLGKGEILVAFGRRVYW